MDTDVKEIKADVKTITQKSVKRWDGIVDKLLWLVIGATIARADRCVMCGAIIPEGTMVCPICKQKVEQEKEKDNAEQNH